MIYFKTCPRCSGDQAVEKDMYGWYVVCLHCGHVAYPDVQSKRKQPAAGSRSA